MIHFPRPQDNEVHIHCLPLASGASRHVSPDEMQRAARLQEQHKREQFLAARGLLRTILGGYLGTKPEELQFAVGENGKPHLCGSTGCDEQIHFNLSHSGALFLLAVATDREVGIDAEQLLDDTPIHNMARLAFSPREQSELFALPEHLQRSAFYRCWTRKEACLKACGLGFALRPNSFYVSLEADSPTLSFIPDDNSSWFLQDIAVPARYCAALATNGSPLVVNYIKPLY